MNVAYSVSVADAEQFGPAQPPGVRDQQLRQRTSTDAPHDTWLHQDGEGKPRQHADTMETPFEPLVWQRIEALAQAESLTPFAIACTVFALLLARIAGGPVPVWSPIRRDRQDLSSLPSSATALVRFVPTIPAESVIAAAHRAMRLHVEAIETAACHVPEIDAQACCFTFEDPDQCSRHSHPEPAIGDRNECPPNLPRTVPDWDLHLIVRPPVGPEPGLLRLTVDAASFRLPRVRSLLSAYTTLLTATLVAPQMRPDSLPLAAAHDRPRVWPDAPLGAPCALQDEPSDMIALFDAIVRRWPTATAIAWQGGAMTFSDLARSADTVAGTLRAQGATATDIVAFRLTSEAHAPGRALFAATQVAAFRIGCALLPLGQQLPSAQARSQIAAVGARFVLAATPDLDCAPAWDADAHRTALDDFPGAFLLAGHDRGPASKAGTAHDRGPAAEAGTALLLTSSGTTGVPKTIRLSQAMLLGMLRAVAATGLVPPLPQVMGQNIGFDITVHDVWMPWLFGRHVVLLNTERRTPQALADARALGARVISLSPTVATAALNADGNCFAGFDALLLVGEVLPPALVRRLKTAAAETRLVNGYGPTESAVLATLADVQSDDQPNVPIGAALPGYRVRIVDPELRPLPPHWPGEIAIACAAPALGYHDTAMTAGRFVELQGEAPGPFFRTGDIGWIDEQGMVRFCGRRDRQVKLHGVRIEIDGVEHLIAELDGIADVGVVFLDGPSQPRIVAVVQPTADQRDNDALAARVLAHCQAWLPRAAVPSEFVFVEAMPMGLTGKKSHAALQALVLRQAEQNRPASGTTARTLPEPGSVEAQLADLWQDLLCENGIQTVGIDLDADVFALGATSLDALCMAERFERAFGVHFPDHQVFVRRTIRQQAALVQAAATPARSTAPVAKRLDLRLQMVRAACDMEPSRGVVLGMPMMGGGNPYLGVLAANALRNYDIWGFAANLGGRTLLDGDLWIDCARAITDKLLAPGAIRPRAMIGFSVGGLIGWLVDRYLVAAGWVPTPVINLDGGSHAGSYHKQRRTAAPPLPQSSETPAGRMLLLHRGARTHHASPFSLAADWADQNVVLDVLHCRTVCHQDFVRRELFTAADAALIRFLETGTVVAEPACRWLNIDTPGGALFTMLELDCPPPAEHLRALMAGLPSGKIEPDLRVGLVFLSLASGDADWALALARRLNDEDPNFRVAVYARVAVLAELDRPQDAAAIAGAWSNEHGPDLAMEQRALRKTGQPLDWKLTRNLYVGAADKALDVAAAFCKLRHVRTRSSHPRTTIGTR